MRTERLYGVIADGFGLEADSSLNSEAVTDHVMALERHIADGGIVACLNDVAKLMIDIMSSFSVVCEKAHGYSGATKETVLSLAQLYRRIQKNFDHVFRKINEALRLPQPGLDLSAIAVFIDYLDKSSKCLLPKSFDGWLGCLAKKWATEIGYDHDKIKQRAARQHTTLLQSYQAYQKVIKHVIHEFDLIRALKPIKPMVGMIIHFTRDCKDLKLDREFVKRNLEEPLNHIEKKQSEDANVSACLLQRPNGGDSLLEKINVHAFLLSLALRAIIKREQVVAYRPIASPDLIIEPVEQLFFNTRTTLVDLTKRYDAMYVRTQSPLPSREPKAVKLGFWQKWSALSTQKKWMFGALVLTEAVAIAVLALFVPGSALITFPVFAWATTNILAAMAGGISAVALDCYLISKSKPSVAGLYKQHQSNSNMTHYDNHATFDPSL